MSEATVVVLSNVEEKHGSNEKGPWTKYTLKDGNGQTVGGTFSAPLGDAAKSLIGQRVEVDLKPPRDPKFSPDVLAVRPAPPESSKNGDSPGLSKEEWRLKDKASDKRACIAIAAGSLTHTLPSSPTQDQLAEFTKRVLYMAQLFSDAVVRERGDTPAEVPFE